MTRLLALVIAAVFAWAALAAAGVQAQQQPPETEFQVVTNPAKFGPAFPDDGVEGVLRLASPPNGCEPFAPHNSKAPWIAVMTRTRGGQGCRYDDKVRNAQKGGAVAAIIYNDGPEDALPSMELPPDSEEPEIPSAIISIRAANEIFELMKAHPGGGVKARMRGRRATVFVPGAPSWPPPGRLVVLSGTSDQIRSKWDATIALMSPGDVLQVSPQGGALEVPRAQPLVVPIAITLAGAPPPADGGEGAAGPPGAPRGAAVIKCGPETDEALHIKAPGAVLQDFFVTGCDGGAAVVLKRAAPGPGMTGGAVYPIAHPVRVRRVTFADSRTTALQMEAGTGATITQCSFLRNGDYRGELDISYPALLGYEGTNLAIKSSYFAGNRNTSLHFQGELLEVKGCRFEHNLHSAIEVDFLQPPVALYNLYKGNPTPPPLFGTARIAGSSFRNNSAPDHAGGAVYVRKSGVVSIDRCNFTENFAAMGGAVFVEEGAWLARLTGSRLVRNEARAYGGGAFVYASGCQKLRDELGAEDVSDDCFIVFDGLTAINNTAADGGALYLEPSPDMRANFTAGEFTGNSAHGQAPADAADVWLRVMQDRDRRSCVENRGRTPAGWGGAVYLGLSGYGSSFFEDVQFSRNRAARGGGAAHVCSLSPSAGAWAALGLKRAELDGNWAGEEDGSVPAGTQGGALHVAGNHLETALDWSNFTSNRAARGGAVSWSVNRGAFGLASLEFMDKLRRGKDDESDAGLNGWPLLRWPAVYRGRAGYSPAPRSRFERNAAERGDGGAFALAGTGSAFLLLGATLADNSAALGGGAVSCFSDGGELLMVASMINNTAATVGGGGLLAGGAGLNATLTKTSVTGNRAAAAAGAAAGGGFCCRGCANVRLEGAAFIRNVGAAFGGGAAVLRATGGAVVEGCEFRQNLAATPGAAPAGRRRAHLRRRGSRLLLQAAPAAALGGFGEAAGSGAALVSLGDVVVDPANVTGDDMLYPGGGGLYASAASSVVLRGSSVVDNEGANGGGVIVRTDMCNQTAAALMSGNGTPQCFVLGGGNAITRNNATEGIGGGLLVTNASLAFTSCSSDASPLGAAALVPLGDCLAKSASSAAGGAKGGASAASLGLPYNNVAEDGDTDDLGSIVAKLVVSCVEPAAGAAGPVCGTGAAAGAAGASGAPPGGVAVPPGGVFQAKVVVEDWQGSRIASGSDANLVLQAHVFNGIKWLSDIVTVGNFSIARRGVAEFPSLQVMAPPGNYQLRFAPLALQHHSLAPASLPLRVRGCGVGEANLTALAGAAGAGAEGVLAPCQRCRPGTVSLDPLGAGGCNLCENSAHANCTGSVMLPNDGWWHSHPRSPLVQRCLVSAACEHKGKLPAMAAWAVAHAGRTITELEPIYKQYVDMQCAPGYAGVLCGECSAGYGRRGQFCSPCSGGHFDRFAYFMALSWMFLLMSLSAVSQKRKEHLQDQASAFFNEGLAPAPGFAPRALNGHAASVLHETEEGPEDQLGPFAAPGASLASGGGSRGAPSHLSGPEGSRNVPVFASPEVSRNLAHLDSRNSQGFGRGLGQGALSGDLGPFAGTPSVTLDAASPFENQPSAFAAQAGRSGGGGSYGGYGDGDVDADGGARAAGSRVMRRQRSSLKRIWSIDTVDGQRAAAALLQQPSVGAASSGHRGTLTGTGTAASDAAASVPVPRRSQTWLSNIFKLLITHLQLLGLLRGIQMDLPGGLDKALSYVDQTQAFSTWVVVDCLFGGNQPGNPAGLRPSIIRILVLLMLPIGATALGVLFWLGVGCIHWLFRRHGGPRAVRRPVAWSYYQPRIVMTIGMVLFYFYPQVSDAVVSILVSCTPADEPSNVPRGFLPIAGQSSPGGSVLTALKAVGSFWNLDTHYQCFEGPMKWMLAMGIVWLVLFCAGFPVTMALILWANKSKLEEELIELKYGFFFDSYRAKYFFWESIMLLEKLALSLVLTGTARYGAPPQVLGAQCVMFLFLMVQIRCRPYACRMLDTLQLASLYALMGTSFVMMAPALNEVMAATLGASDLTTSAVTGAALGVAGILNISVVVAFGYAMYVEGRRMLLIALDRDGDGRITWEEAKIWLWGNLPPLARRALPRRLRPAAAGGPGGDGGRGGAGGGQGEKAAATVVPPFGPPQEFVDGPPTLNGRVMD